MLPLSAQPIKSLTELTLFAALIIGCFQALAVFPGASRSGMAITGALIIGLNHQRHRTVCFSTKHTHDFRSIGIDACRGRLCNSAE